MACSSSSSSSSLPTQQQQQRHVRVGVGAIVKKQGVGDNRIYCGIRKNSHGAGSLALPGGHLELYEEWSRCAQREVFEEMGIRIHDVQYCHVTNDVMPTEHKHYVTIFMMACSSSDNEPQTMEPEKCEGWKAYSWQQLKDIHAQDQGKLFGPLAKLVQDEPQALMDFLSCSTPK